MSQSAFNIPNEVGATFRSDVNTALQALASQSAGNSAPATTYAYQPWYDTTNNLLKIRNGANSVWVIIGPLADSSKHVIYTNNTAQVYVDSSGKVGIGVPSPTEALDVAGSVNVSGSFKVGGVAIPTGYTFINGGTAGFSADAYTSTPSPAIASYSANQMFLVLLANTNTTTTPTFNFNALGAKTVKKQIGAGKVAVAVGDLQSGTFVLLAYDGTDLMLINPRQASQGADIASASTLNLSTATGDYINVTGTTTINAITLGQGLRVILKFAGICTITNGASLICPGAANIVTAAGDVIEVIGEASSVVRVGPYALASGKALVAAAATISAGSVIGKSYVTYATNVGLTTAIPFDNTVPQSSEGTQIISGSYTPQFSNSILRISFFGWGSVSAGVLGIAAALFVNGASSASASGSGSTGGTSSPGAVVIPPYEYAPGTTSSQSFTIRVGGNSGTVSLNGVNAGNYFGASAFAVMLIEEIKQ